MGISERYNGCIIHPVFKFLILMITDVTWYGLKNFLIEIKGRPLEEIKVVHPRKLDLRRKEIIFLSRIAKLLLKV